MPHPQPWQATNIQVADQTKEAKIMTTKPNNPTQNTANLPPDNPTRTVVHTRSDDHYTPHIGLVGDTYTILLKGKDTAGRYCLIDMHVPPGGGPPPHRH